MKAPRWLPALLAFLLLAGAVAIGFRIQGNDRHQAKVDTCLSVLRGAQRLADLIGNTPIDASPVDPSLPQSVQDLITRSREQQKKFLLDSQRSFLDPLPICKEVGIESRIVLKSPSGTVLVPEVVPAGVIPAATTTTQSAARAPSSSEQPEPTGSTVGSPTTTQPPTTTEATTTTTAPQPPPPEPLIRICVIHFCVM